MADSAGGVEFYVDVDTNGAVQSTKQIQSENEKVTKSFKGVDTQVTKSSKAVKQGLSSAKGAAQNFSYQIQDIAVQLAGGQNPILILSQQLPQMLVGLGAAAAGIGALTAVAGGLFLAFGQSADAVDEMKKAIEKYSAVVTLSAEGNAEFTSSLQAIAARSKEVAGQLSSISAARALIAAREAAKSVKDEIAGFGSVFGETFGSLSQKLGVTRQQLGALQGSAEALQKGATIERIEAFEKAIASIGRTGGVVSKDTLDLKERLLELADGMRLSLGVADALKVKVDDYGNSAAEAAKKSKDLVDAVRVQAETLGFTERQMAIYTATQIGATDADKKAINAHYDKIESFEAQEKATKEAAQAAKEYNDETFRQLQAEEKAAQATRKRAVEQEKLAKSRLTQQATGVADNRGDPLAALQAQKDQELAILRQAEEQGLKLHTDYATLRANIDKDFAAQEQVLREQKYAQESLQNELALSSLEAFGDASTNVISGLLSGTYSATEAMQQFANTILNNVVGSLVDIGIQYIKNAIIAQTADKAVMASQAAAKAANATQYTASVSAMVAVLSSLAAAGAFASTVAIPGGIAVAPAAAAAAAASTATLGSAAVAATPIAGARYSGGNVSGGRTYEMGEKNKPEMLVIPGNNGRVFSNSDTKKMMSGGGGGSNITINNNAPGVQVIDRGSQTDGVTTSQVLEIISGESARVGSNLNRNINKNHNVTNTLRGNRRN